LKLLIKILIFTNSTIFLPKEHNLMFSHTQLSGVFPALFTPLLPDDARNLRNSIDYKKAQQMIDDLIAAGVNGMVPVGTTGQSATLSHSQHLDFIKFTLEYVDNRVPVIAGAGSNCTRESVEIISAIQKIATVPVLCVTGYYNNPPKEGVLEHFKTLSGETGAQIVLYNVPGRTHCYMSPETIIELAQDKNFIGLKQAVDFRIDGAYREDTQRIIRETKALDFAVVSGEDDGLSAILELGGSGIITATGNIPEAASLMVKIVEFANQGDHEEARKLQKDLRDYVDLCFCRKNPIPLGTFFNSPLLQPLVSVLQTERGADAHAQIMKLVATRAKSLQKYH
jgi:4-hydroxy-tetrahydrodipicolinate synthase